MRIERSTVDQIKQRFETLKRKQAETFTEEGKPLRMCRSRRQLGRKQPFGMHLLPCLLSVQMARTRLRQVCLLVIVKSACTKL
jgi:hypothetical protein